MNRKAFAIARWEFKEKVRKTSFLIFTLLFPIVIIVLSLIPSINSGDSEHRSMFVIALVNFSDKEAETYMQFNSRNRSLDEVSLIFVQYNDPENNSAIESRIKSVLNKRHFEAALMRDNSGLPILYYSTTFPIAASIKLQSIVNKISVARDYPDTADIKINELSAVKVEPEFATASLMSFYYSFSFLVLLAFLTLFSGGTFVRSFLYEKSSGLIELYFSSVSGLELVTGKLIGLIMLGLLQTIIWIVFGLIVLGSSLPFEFYSLTTLIQVAFFLLGYVLYSIIFLGAGSLIVNEYQAQQVTALLSVIMIFPLLTSVEILSSPNSMFAEILTYFPLTTAPLVIIRSGVNEISTSELVTAFGIIFISILTGLYISAKLYTASVLIRAGKIKNLLSLLKK